MMDGLCGIDEAGRGPFAGPMCIAGVVLKNHIEKLNDSKKLTEKRREELFDVIQNNSIYHIVMISNKQIDDMGLSACLKMAIEEIMLNISAKDYLMDGNTTFGIKNLKSLIKADATVKEVSAASILAKVTRDRYMVDMAKKYPEYSFEKHKGYGTKVHKDAIREYGFCEIHRMSYNIKL